MLRLRSADVLFCANYHRLQSACALYNKKTALFTIACSFPPPPCTTQRDSISPPPHIPLPYPRVPSAPPPAPRERLTRLAGVVECGHPQLRQSEQLGYKRLERSASVFLCDQVKPDHQVRVIGPQSQHSVNVGRHLADG